MIGNGTNGLIDNFAPVSTECDEPRLTVLGELPRALNGTLFRNGPNPQFAPPDPSQHHWFAGDGMIHAFSLSDGRASYRNRWVRTSKWQAEHAAAHALVAPASDDPASDTPREDQGVANTNVVWHAGRLWALEEAHLPIELDPATLDTRGVQSLGDTLQGPFTAHP